MFNLTPIHLYNDFQNSDVNLTSLSLIILSGIPNIHIILSKTSLATSTAFILVKHGMIVTYFVNVSTMTTRQSLPLSLVGK